MSLKDLLDPVLPQFPSTGAGTDVEILKEIPVETLYLALKDSDAENALWFFEHALPEQVQGLLDIDCWQGSEFLAERFDSFFKMICLCSANKVAAYMRELDPEVIVRGLLEYFSVQDFDPQNPPEMPESQFMITLDSKYALILNTENPELRETIYLWLDKFSSSDLGLLRRHLESCKWEQRSDLEEFAYQVKKGRLEDMGFVDYHEALALYARGSSPEFHKEILSNLMEIGTKEGSSFKKIEAYDDVLSPPTAEFLPLAFSDSLHGIGFLGEALAGISNKAVREVLSMEILRAINMGLAADKLLQGDLEEIKRHSKLLHRYMDLGLMILSAGKVESAREFLERSSLFQILRLGWLSLQDLVFVASSLQNKWGTHLLAPKDNDLLDELKGHRHPVLSQGVCQDLNVNLKTFPSLVDILYIQKRLTILAALGKFFNEDLEHSLKLKAQALHADESAYSRLLTLLFRQACGVQELSFTSLSKEEWAGLAPLFNKEKMLSILELIQNKVPETAKDLFKKRCLDLIEDIEKQASTSPEKLPDRRFFKALNV